MVLPTGVLPATFNKSSIETQFTLQDLSSIIQPSISLDFRSRENHTTLLYTGNGNQFVLLELVEGLFNVRYNLGSSGNISSGKSSALL